MPNAGAQSTECTPNLGPNAWHGTSEEVSLVWVPRHRNLEADRLSRQALGLPAMPLKLAPRRRRSR